MLMWVSPMMFGSASGHLGQNVSSCRSSNCRFFPSVSLLGLFYELLVQWTAYFMSSLQQYSPDVQSWIASHESSLATNASVSYSISVLERQSPK